MGRAFGAYQLKLRFACLNRDMWYGLYLDTFEFGYGALYHLHTTRFTGRGAVRSRAVTILREPEAKPTTSDSHF